MEVLQSRRKGKVRKLPRSQQTNHPYVPVAQKYVRTPHTLIVEP